MLSRREHSGFELSQKLAQREFESGEIQQAIKELEHDGWLSDARFTESYIRMRRLKGYGPVRIKMELKDRGVKESVIDAYLDSDNRDWQDVLNRQYEKKYHSKPIADYADKARRIRFLQYRGFTLAMIQRVVE